MIGMAVSKYVVKKGTVGLIAYPMCFNITLSTGMCKQQRINNTNFWLANHPLLFKVTSYSENITSAKSTSDIFKSENYHFSVGEPSANVGEPSASVGEPSASVGEPSASVGGTSASVGETFASVGGTSASVGEPSASVGGTFARVGGTSASVGGIAARVGRIAARVENNDVALENNAIKIEKWCFMECGISESTPVMDRIN